eukprot:Pompholyxophrys_punicea_v1_NODE_416_length_2017_cov_2.186544.p4 type:complete len:105 gc:universal NODE_416_length_2017_cov_2.186544:909-1223(+)
MIEENSSLKVTHFWRPIPQRRFNCLHRTFRYSIGLGVIGWGVEKPTSHRFKKRLQCDKFWRIIGDSHFRNTKPGKDASQYLLYLRHPDSLTVLLQSIRIQHPRG